MFKMLKILLVLFFLTTVCVLSDASDASKGDAAASGSSLPDNKLTSAPFKSLRPIYAYSVPKVDGSGNDSAWSGIPAKEFFISSEDGEKKKCIMKICEKSGRYYILLQIPVSALSKKATMWHWDSKRGIYLMGKEVETSVEIDLYNKEDSKVPVDIWVWRSVRTNPMRTADDMYFRLGRIIMDQGNPGWFSKFFGESCGAVLPRFYRRTPEGSAADVTASGAVKDGMLSLELSRAVDTGNKDDLKFAGPLCLRLVLTPGRNAAKLVKAESKTD